jgi:glutathione reductase (NADPH)
MPNYDYDLFVIGGGSGGVRAARVVSSLGKRVGVAEESRFGGTCVIRGCVPKKLMVYASQFSEAFEDAAGYGWTVGETSFDWKTLIANKDREIARLENIYRSGVEKAGGDTFRTRAELMDAHTIRLVGENRTVTADKILIATGGRPNRHPALPGHEHTIVSDQVFDLRELPRSILIAGGGYIAVEFANIFHGLGVETTLIYRGSEILGRFDADIRRGLHEAMERKGIHIRCHDILTGVEKTGDGRLASTTKKGETLVADQVLMALGRTPNTDGLGLDKAGVKLGKAGDILIDAYSRTNVETIFAIGDVTDRLQLTPVAIHEAMCFVQTAFHDNPTKPELDDVPTAVFSQPEIGTVGLTEDDAVAKLGDIDVYRAIFRPMRNVLPGREERMILKLVVEASSQRVVGAHILGPDAGELAQLLGVAVKGRLTKDVFDRTMAVHPTAAEELVTMYQPTYRIRGGERLPAAA